MYNAQVSDLSFYAQSWYHAKTEYKTIKKINKSHPFIIKVGIANKGSVLDIIEDQLEQLRKKKRSPGVSSQTIYNVNYQMI
jgi:hypothetical protein